MVHVPNNSGITQHSSRSGPPSRRDWMTQQVWAPQGWEVGRCENEYHLAPSRTSCKKSRHRQDDVLPHRRRRVRAYAVTDMAAVRSLDSSLSHQAHRASINALNVAEGRMASVASSSSTS